MDQVRAPLAPSAVCGAGTGRAATWAVLRGRLRQEDLPLCVRGPAACRVCRGPVSPGCARCFQCDRHHREGAGLLADAVVPVAYAVRGGRLADDLWRYKSAVPGAAAARARLRALLLVFLRDHGECVWREAGMPGPGLVAVVPSGGGRPGPHPLRDLALPYLSLPVAGLSVRPEAAARGRDVSVTWLRSGRRVSGASVLLIEDTWVSGGSAQSAAAALKAAGAARVAVVVLGRHLNPADPLSARLVSSLRTRHPWLATCAVHPDRTGAAPSTAPAGAPAPAAPGQ
ncbi:MAG: hypothetical protein JOY82_26115 [Streptosporangiaceae bacterium]|nr:hypothetical protein [Streptosporangiaceae bacterium]MBV9857961.1 hypothetical protein [Streptosporangiaceae bacterium]